MILMTGDDSGTVGRTRGRIRVFEGSDSVAFLSGPAALVAATSPERPRRVRAKPEEVDTGSRLSGITEGIIGHDPVAMESTEGGVVGL